MFQARFGNFSCESWGLDSLRIVLRYDVEVWSDDTVKDIIEGSFLFWQRDDKSTEGDQFCHYHQCGRLRPKGFASFFIIFGVAHG